MNPHAKTRGFSLIELLVSMAVFSIILLVCTSLLGTTQQVWGKARATSQQFREARIGFERMTERIAQASLNTYWDNEFAPGGSADPIDYVKKSELHFISGPTAVLTPAQPSFQSHAIFFQAPFGQTGVPAYREANNLLNAWGYVIAFGDDTSLMPNYVATGGVVEPRNRFRLFEFRQNTEELAVYGTPTANPPSSGGADAWYQGNMTPSNLRVLAENIIALVIHPLRSDDPTSDDLSPNYLYDSRAVQKGSSATQAARWEHELPPLLRITMVAVDEPTVARMQGNATSPHSAITLPSGAFQSTASYDADLDALKAQLLAARVNYRVFSTIVPIRNSKWSE